ncbi:hypothetical protein [Flavobacterium sp.]
MSVDVKLLKELGFSDEAIAQVVSRDIPQFHAPQNVDFVTVSEQTTTDLFVFEIESPASTEIIL